MFLLHDFKNNKQKDYIFNEKFIVYCFRLIRTNGKIDTSNFINDDIYKRIYNFFIDFNNNNDNNVKFNCHDDILSMTHITDALARDIHTNIKNNITINYFKYLKEYININLKIEFNNDKNIIINNSIINNVFNDIRFNTYYSNNIYHNWINKHKKLLIPNLNNNIKIDSIENGIEKYYKNITQFINKFVKDNETLNNLK